MIVSSYLKRISVPIIFIFLFLRLSTAQTITVLDAESLLPIPGVALVNKNKSKTIITDTKGEVSLSIFNANEVIFFKDFLYEEQGLTKSQIVKNKGVVYLFPKVEGLDQILISASKFEQHKRDIPQTIVNVSAKDIVLANPQTSADLLEGTGHIYIQKSQLGGGSPMIRGFSTNRLLIAVDGVRMNNAIFRGGNLQNVISIDPFAVQHTEVTLGAGSVVYGSDAIGGVMSFYTKKPQFSETDALDFSATALTRFATANKEKTGHIDFNLGYQRWAFLTSVSYTDFDDLRMGSHGPDDYLRTEYVTQANGEDRIVANSNPQLQTPTGYNQINLMQKLRYKSSEYLDLDLGLYYSTTSDYSRYDRLIRYRDDALRSAEWNYGPQQWFMGNFQLTKRSSSSNLYDKIQTTLAFQNFKESREDRDFQSEIRSVRAESVDAISFNLDLEKSLNSKTSLFYGVEYLHNTVHSKGHDLNIETGAQEVSVTRYPDGATWQSIAAYASFKYKPHPKFVFQTGLRFNQVMAKADFTANNVFLNLPFDAAEVNTGALTGTAGITWSPSDFIQWKLNASTAFRAPNIDDIGKVFDSEPGAVVVPNKDLKAEYAYSGELGLKLQFNKHIILDVATYYTFLDEALIRRDYELNGETELVYNGELSTIQAIQNASKAWIYGFEAGLELHFSKYLQLRSQYNVIGGTEDNNGVEEPVRHVAPNFGRTHLRWKKKKVLLDAFMVYNNALSFQQLSPSETSKDYIYALDANGNPYAPAWHTFNIRTQYQYSDQLSFTASLENITDQRYRPYSSGISAAGRNFILALKYTL
ncbi:TonB-dependent receptor plug domain-containing protein [Winogradskyella sediminis]|uniref:TonB-dependent receptor plug domain-containing protein n=1 Tax=Winogradskyella sediminis TaxID=1382466 RepID=UPI000E248B9B|nr:TonB-dependent receptor [Winogradskyella sediminis]REG89135.1 hemoglobin/transferrin/lactoferrin receptor protein [Winogradskyella sediminis]